MINVAIPKESQILVQEGAVLGKAKILHGTLKDHLQGEWGICVCACMYN